MAERAKTYGLSNVGVLHFPANGKIFYGTQRSRMGWGADKSELTEVRDGKEIPATSFAAMSVALAEDSESAELVADLVDVGKGDSETDYASKQKGATISPPWLPPVALADVRNFAIQKIPPRAGGGDMSFQVYFSGLRARKMNLASFPSDCEKLPNLLSEKPVRQITRRHGSQVRHAPGREAKSRFVVRSRTQAT